MAEDTTIKFGRRLPRDSPDLSLTNISEKVVTSEKISGREHGKGGHVTVTTVRCNCSNGTDYHRYRVPKNVFLLR